MDENFEDFDDGFVEPVYREPEYKLSDLVEVNALIEELARVRGSLCIEFLRESFWCVVSDPMMKVARSVFDAIARGDLAPVQIITTNEDSPPKQIRLRYSSYMNDSFRDFLDRVDLFDHPDHTLYVLRDDARRLWPELRSDKLGKLPRARDAEVVAFLNGQPPLNEKEQQAAVAKEFGAHITRERLRKLPIARRAQGRPPLKN